MRDKKAKAAYDRKWHRRQRKLGLCGSHRNVRAVDGKSYCEKCLLDKRLRLLRAIGLPESEIDKARIAWKKFKGKCWACGSKNPGTKGWTTDHDHKLLKFRGILCSPCNLALGYVRDSIKRLKNLVKYLRRSK